jgi:hypothetical protein
MKNKYLGIIFTGLFLASLFVTAHAQISSLEEISITVPEKVITRLLTAALPLNLDKELYLKGRLWIHTIDDLKIGSNQMEFDMRLRGENIKFETQLGGQTLMMDIGNLDAAFSCKALLRYDAPQRRLYITPYLLQKPDETKADKMAANLLQLLSLTNGMEYPVEIQKLQSLTTQVGGELLNIDMEITNIYTENHSLFITGQPQLEKQKPSNLSKKSSQ